MARGHLTFAPALIAATLIALPASAADEDEAVEPADEGDVLYETVVVGEPASEEGLSRTRISRGEIRRRGAATAAEVVEQEPSVFAQPDRKGERTFRIRGFDQRGVDVTLDGVPFALPYGGTVDLGKLPAETIDSVLLIKGPTSVVHGPGGMGGSVLVRTRDPSRGPLLETELEVGRSWETRYGVYHGRDAGPFSYSLGFGGVSSDGYRLSSRFEPRENEDGGVLDNSDREIRHISGKLSVPMGAENTLDAQAFVLDGEFGIPRSITDERPYFRRYTFWRASIGQVGHVYDGPDWRVEDAIYAGVYDNRLDAFDDDTYSSMEEVNSFRSWYRDRSWGGKLLVEYTGRFLPAGDAFARIWLGVRSDSHGSSHQSVVEAVEGDAACSRVFLTVVPEVEIPIVEGLVGIASAQIDVDAPQVEESSEIDPDDLAGLETAVAWGPFVSVRYDPLDELMLRLTAARRNRFPTLGERFSGQLGYSKPNPRLEPESAWHFGLDVKWRAHRAVDVEVSGFDAEVDDMIDVVREADDSGQVLDQKRNVGRARFAGAEASLVVRPVDGLDLRAGYAYLYACKLEGDLEENRVEQIPEHQAVLGLVGRPASPVEISSMLRVVGPQAFQDRNILSWGELGTYVVWDARIEIEVARSLSLWAKATNMLDMNYQTRYGYPDRGWSLWGGVRLRAD